MVRRDAGAPAGRRDASHAHEPGRDPRQLDGYVSGYVGTLEDVTDEADGRKRAELALQARVAAEALVAETSRSLVTASVDDVDEQVVAVLERLARFVGADAAVLAGRRDEIESGAARRHAWRHPESLDPEQATATARGRSAPSRSSGAAVRRTVDREALEPLVVVGDALVSTLARVRAEQAVRTSEERFRSLAEHSSDFMLVYSENGDVQYLSPATARFSGFEVGANFADSGIVHPDDVAAGGRGVRTAAGRAGRARPPSRSRCGSASATVSTAGSR